MPNQIGLARLMRLALAGEDLAPLGQSLLQRAAESPSESPALLDAAIICELIGRPDTAILLQREALKHRRHYQLPAARPARLRLLALVAPGPIMANVPLECLLEEADIELELYYADADAPTPDEIPDHDLLFVAIGESEVNRPILEALHPRLRGWPRPVLNDPRLILGVARDIAYQRLSGQPGLIAPVTSRLGRDQLGALISGAAVPQGLAFPLIVRPLDSHAGRGLTKVDGPEELSIMLAGSTADAFFVSPFIDYRSADGFFRKYRVVLIDGRPFPCHMAISDHWMIHYLNAGMAESADKRAEEAAFMAGFEQEFAARQGAALAAIHEAIGLDYLGIDCAETADGRLLIFEVDPAMVVHAMDPVDLYPYKQPAMRKVFDAFRAMLIAAATQRAAGSPASADG
jgi:glutathione synthase/RimK-type ligase-like ATP-grasp enzyme